MDEIKIRPYRSEDRPSVREICYLTGYMGDPPDFYWQHRDSFMEVWTAYYTDQEPESTFVAEYRGRIVGYLLGCVDTARAPSPSEMVQKQLWRHALLFRPGTAGFFWRSIADLIRQHRLPEGELRDARYPAHLHINLMPEVRGRGAGAALIRAWLNKLRSLGSPGCHLSTLLENPNGVPFFERMGFRKFRDPVLIPGMRTPSGERIHEITLIQEIESL